MITLQSKHPLNESDRQRLITRLSLLVMGYVQPSFEPYQPNALAGGPGDGMWAIDAGNDWKLFFEGDRQFGVRYRYDDAYETKARALAR